MKTELKINEEPKVTILWSEYNAFKDNSTFLLSRINKKLHFFDMTSNSMGYYKTAFRISYIMQGEEQTYEGRYDIGVEKDDLIKHIEKFVASSSNLEKLPKDIIDLPSYLKAHNAISEFQEEYQMYIANKKGYTDVELKFLEDALKFCEQARESLNKGSLKEFISNNDIPIPQELPKELRTLLGKEMDYFKNNIANIL